MNKREDIDEKYKWNLEAIYKDINSFNKDEKKLNNILAKIDKSKDNMLNSGKDLYDVTELVFNSSRILYKLYTYASLKFNENISLPSSIELMDRVSNIDLKVDQTCAFYDSDLLSIDYSKIEEMYEDYAPLRKYEIYFKRQFRYKEHMLSKDEEKLLVDLSKALSDNESIFCSLTDSDIDFGKITDSNGCDVTLTNTNFTTYVTSKNRRVRKDAFKQLYGTYKRYKTTLTNCLDGHVKHSSTISKIRKYNSLRESELFDDELDVKVFDTLVESVSDGLKPLYKYFDIKKKFLEIDEMHIYDTYAPLSFDFTKQYSYEEAQNIIKDVLKVFGDEYVSMIDKAFKERWIDVYPTPSKTGGAFSGGCYDTYPYILTNFQGRYNDVSTIIHELGHSMHSYYSRNNNDFVYSDYSIVVAEVASTVNELLLAKYMIKNSKNLTEKLFVLDSLLSLFKSTIYRQTMYEEFEKFLFDRVENDEALTSDVLCDYFYKLNQKYFGDGVVLDDEIRYEWERMPHLYYNFYMYKYATGLSSASYIVDSILNGKKDAVDNYIKFLKSGCTLAPNEELKITGVDLTKKSTFDSAIKMFSELVDEFEKCYDEYIKGVR